MTGHHHLMANMFTAGVTLAQRVLEKKETQRSLSFQSPLFSHQIVIIIRQTGFVLNVTS